MKLKVLRHNGIISFVDDYFAPLSTEVDTLGYIDLPIEKPKDTSPEQKAFDTIYETLRSIHLTDDLQIPYVRDAIIPAVSNFMREYWSAPVEAENKFLSLEDYYTTANFTQLQKEVFKVHLIPRLKNFFDLNREKTVVKEVLPETLPERGNGIINYPINGAKEKYPIFRVPLNAKNIKCTYEVEE